MKYKDLDLGTIEAVFNKLGGLEMAKRFLRNELEIVATKRIIDCDTLPFIPDDWEIVEHRKGGKLEWNPEKVSLYLSKIQKTGRIGGNELRNELTKKPVLNACVLDYLLANPHLIPDEWKDKNVFFWGTVYRSRNGYLYVRYLFWCGGKWYWSTHWLDGGWDSDCPAVCS